MSAAVELSHGGTEVAKHLTPQEQYDLGIAEQTIRKGLKTFVEVGEALMQIRDGRLYRNSHDTFEAYCKERWNLLERRVYQLMTAASVGKNFLNNCSGKSFPSTESQARPLTKLKEPEQQREAWDKAQALAEDEGKPVTARHVKAAVDTLLEPTPEEWAAQQAAAGKAEPIEADVVIEPKVKGKLAPCRGLVLADLAIAHLSEISWDDLERKAALKRVEKWIWENK